MCFLFLDALVLQKNLFSRNIFRTFFACSRVGKMHIGMEIVFIDLYLKL